MDKTRKKVVKKNYKATDIQERKVIFTNRKKELEIEIAGIMALKGDAISLSERERILKKIMEIADIINRRPEANFDIILLYKERELENVNAILKRTEKEIRDLK